MGEDRNQAAYAAPPPAQMGTRLRLVALPSEHGAWSFLAEPIALGLLVAPSPAGLLLALSAAGAFLVRQPLALALSDLRRGKRYPRTAWAERFALLYGIVSLAAFALALSLSPGFWPALALAAPLALVQMAYDVRRQSRALVAELAGAGALAAAAAAIALAGGWQLAPALALWAVLAARSAPSIAYVRACIQRQRGIAADGRPALVAHALGLAAVAGLAAAGLAPWLAAAALALLLGRAARGLAPGRPAVRPAVIGVQELAFGAATVLLTAIGVALGL